ncbi:MAG: hypothetical protein K8H88_10295 [Sandaracinaceae bacterium]|nr:hypothetical protein [Sandaracinaceae bacterium]
MNAISSLDGVATVERLDGRDADPHAPPALLVEVPHGADRRAHFDALRARLAGDLPPDLHLFFHANTDLGAWDYGRRVAERIVALDPRRSALVIRCLIPRTFIDTNRLEEATDQLASGGLTAGLAPYVRHPDDRALLVGLHRRYVALVEAAYALVCDAGGFALNPHTYGPRSMGIAKIDDDIAQALRDAYAPGTWESWPLRPEIDLLTRDAEGNEHAPDGMSQDLLSRYGALGFDAKVSVTYTLHPSTQGWRWVTRWPKSVLCLEVRRDLLVREFDLFAELEVDAARVETVATPLVESIDAWLRQANPGR